jgi:hypothetical protein
MKKQLVMGLVGLGLFLAGCTEKPTDTTLSSTNNQTNTRISSSTEAEPAESSSAIENAALNARTITGVSGNTYSLDLPDDWQEVEDFESLNPDNDFMLSDPLQTTFLAAVAEPKEDFTDLDTYLGLVQENLSASFDTDATFLSVPDTNIHMVDFPATVEGLNIHYLYYVMETDNNFVQLYGWTLESAFEESKAELTSIMNSFQEVSQ